ncbi:MAG: hypothetical protein ACKVU1_04715 [bacterium]
MTTSAGGIAAPPPIESYFRGALRVESREANALFAHLVVPADLQGPRDVTHGGAVTTFLVELARLRAAQTSRSDPTEAPFVVDASFHKELRVETRAVARAIAADDDESECSVERDDGSPIARARVGRARQDDLAALAERAGGERLVELLARANEHRAADTRNAPIPERAPDEVPGTAMCLSCGFANPRGLRFRYHADDAAVWKRLALPSHFLSRSRAAFHGAAAIALDEIGWWLGALAFGGCGVSTRLRVVCDPEALADSPLLIAGNRRDAAPADAKGRFWTSRARIFNASGRCAAAATILFAGSHAYTRAMLADLADASDSAAINRVFPRLVGDQIF